MTQPNTQASAKLLKYFQRIHICGLPNSAPPSGSQCLQRRGREPDAPIQKCCQRIRRLETVNWIPLWKNVSNRHPWNLIKLLPPLSLKLSPNDTAKYAGQCYAAQTFPKNTWSNKNHHRFVQGKKRSSSIWKSKYDRTKYNFVNYIAHIK